MVSSAPSGPYRRTAPPPHNATQMPPSSSTVRPSGATPGSSMATIVRRRLISPLIGVEIEGVDPAGPAVGEVHGGAVGAPADAVGDGQAGQHGRAACRPAPAGRARPLRATRRRPSCRPRSDPCASQAPSFIRTSERPASGWASSWTVPASSTCRKPVPAASTYPPLGGRRDRPHMPVQRDGLHRLQSAVDAGPAPVQGGAEDVDPQQLAAFGVPARPLGQKPGGGQAGDRADRASEAADLPMLPRSWRAPSCGGPAGA